ncbi:MAG: hypothetical protein ACE5K8_02615 [Candidatus Zixiibacteriota bacterium]
MAVKTKKKILKTGDEQIRWPFGKRNYLVFALALAVITIGYVALGQGSITLAPILLVLGYCVLIPIALLIKDRQVTDNTDKMNQPRG